eukprot:3082912-Pyramimonas_sp.AAC.1
MGDSVLAVLAGGRPSSSPARLSGEITFRVKALSSPRTGSLLSADCVAEKSLALLIRGYPRPSLLP